MFSSINLEQIPRSKKTLVKYLHRDVWGRMHQLPKLSSIYGGSN